MRRRKVQALKPVVAIVFLAAISAAYLTESHAKSLSRTQARSNPLSPTEKNLALGLDHFTAHCASCHGEGGKGDSEMGRSVRAADLTSPKTQSKPDAELFRIISGGVPGTAMPPFAKSHKPDEIWQTILFLRKLPTLTPQERKKLEAAIPPEARHKHGGEPQETHRHPEQPAQTPQKGPEKATGHEEHQHQTSPTQTAGEKAHAEHSEHSPMSSITGGPYKSMHAVGSGTSLLPATTPGNMWHWNAGEWRIMAHGDIKAGLNHQGGPRGINKAESQNWFMLMAERPTGGGARLMVRGMFSAEPATAPRGGFPELLQTGETFEGRPIVDAQHPHDLFMELAASYTVPLSERVSINLYGGPVGEPALGPVAFMHRASAGENPAAPLGHHWQDSTHIVHGVFTFGVTAGKVKIESSIFRGVEPDEERKDIEMGKLDSWSSRIWYTPTPNWVFQFSGGRLTDPEALEPGDLVRLTASAAYNRSFRDGNWASTLIWGRNHEVHGNSNSYLFESTVNFFDKNYLFTRLELVDKTDLLRENIFGRAGLIDDHAHAEGELEESLERAFRVGAFTLGGVRDFIAASKLRVGIGADVTFYHLPGEVKQLYGSNPTSFHIFLRLRPGKMAH